MTTENISLFQAMNAKMKYLNTRQKVIAQNMANADTPNYQARDVSELKFGDLLDKPMRKKNEMQVSMETTNAGHIPTGGAAQNSKVQKQRITYEVAPDKNGVIMEEQLIKANDVQMNYNLMLNLFRSNNDLLRASLGRGR